MNNFVSEDSAVYMIYGPARSGKTTIVKSLLGHIKTHKVLVVTTSHEDYEDYTCVEDYVPDLIDRWLDNVEGKKVIILDDFMHLNIQNGEKGRHIKGLLSTTRKKKNCSVIVSTHLLSASKAVRDLAWYKFYLIINGDVKKNLKDSTCLENYTIDKFKKTLMKNRYTFLATNPIGETKLLKLRL